jgi:hypothetical protein
MSRLALDQRTMLSHNSNVNPVGTLNLSHDDDSHLIQASAAGRFHPTPPPRTFTGSPRFRRSFHVARPLTHCGTLVRRRSIDRGWL